MIDPAVQEGVKAITARYTAVELITQREKVRSEIKNLLSDRLRSYDIVVDDFSIVNFFLQTVYSGYRGQTGKRATGT